MPQPAFFPWPLECAPHIQIAGRFPLGVSSRGFVYHHATIALHQHDYHGTVRIGRHRFSLRPGDVTLTPPRVGSTYVLPADGFHLCIHFAVAAARGKRALLPLHWRPGAQAAFVTLNLQRIIHTHRLSQQRGEAGRLARAVGSAALQQLLLWIAFAARDRRPSRIAARARTSLEQLQRLLDERFPEPWTVPALAEKVGLSQNYLAGLFHRRNGMTIQQYLLHRRIELAHHLLTTTRKPIKEIAHEVGLPDPHYFNKQFRRLTGRSPSAARGA